MPEDWTHVGPVSVLEQARIAFRYGAQRMFREPLEPELKAAWLAGMENTRKAREGVRD